MRCTSNVTRLPKALTPADRACIHDIVDICKAEGIPLAFGMEHFRLLRMMYAAAWASH